MPVSRHVTEHLSAMRRAVAEIDLEEASFTATLKAQRIRTSAQNIASLSLRTSEVKTALEVIGQLLSRQAETVWTSVELDRLGGAIDVFETALEAAGPNAIAQRIGAWVERPN